MIEESLLGISTEGVLACVQIVLFIYLVVTKKFNFRQILKSKGSIQVQSAGKNSISIQCSGNLTVNGKKTSTYRYYDDGISINIPTGNDDEKETETGKD